MDTRKIAKDYGLRVIHLNKNNFKKVIEKYDIKKWELNDNAFLIEDEIIILGFYKDKSHKNAAFFHEIGHTLINDKFLKMVNDDIQLIEYQAWIEGLKVAQRYGEKIDKKTFKYILKALNSYYKSALHAYNKQPKNKKEKMKKKLETKMQFSFEEQEDVPIFDVDIDFKKIKKKTLNVKAKIVKIKKRTDSSINLF